mgnify:CR=1 FL=1|tara:strand:- start:17124 stop:18047 length:924 start_codon:yes stop_codon:yes gene_type:complete
MPITIGVDIGGSHITSAAVDSNTSKIIPSTYFRGSVNSKGSKASIFIDWARIINKTINAINPAANIRIGFAMPGPFDYSNGIAMFEKNDKYASLYKISIIDELTPFLDNENITFRFLNDATSFGLGAQLAKEFHEKKKVVGITIGTGFGAAFFHDFLPVVKNELVPQGGCLWNKEYQGGIADDYFSTRWFLERYCILSGKKGIKGVKEIVANNDESTQQVFQEFSSNLASFLFPYLLTFNADLLLIGGNITKSHHLFIPKVLEIWQNKSYNIPIQIIQKSEEANLIGASYLFNENFWELIEDKLPVM